MSIFNKDENNNEEYTNIIGGEDENNSKDFNSSDPEYDNFTPEDSSNTDYVNTADENSSSASFINAENPSESETSEVSETPDYIKSYEEFNAAAPEYTGEDVAAVYEEQKAKKSVPIWVIPLVVVIVAVLFVGGYFGIKYIPGLIDNIKLSSTVKDGHYYTALNDYLDIYYEDTSNKTAAYNSAELLLKLGYFSDADSVLTTAYTEEELNSENETKVSKLYAEVLKLNSTSEFVNNLYSELYSGESATFQSAADAIDEVKGTDQYNDAMLSYYEYTFASMFGESTDVQKQYLEEACSYDDDLSYIFRSTLAAFYRFDKNYDKAIEICNEALEFNKDDFAAMIESSYSYLLKEDYEKAVQLAADAYNIEPDNSNTVNSLLLAYAASGKTEEYETLSTTATDQGIEIDSMVTGFVDGTYTLENILLGTTSE